ncbi:hypothetical protein GOP47_0029018 [Adiantum capillus-veneris]|nr:hypothetical protein GOP47_0029018 [Adiantum capillus-veneris]
MQLIANCHDLDVTGEAGGALHPKDVMVGYDLESKDLQFDNPNLAETYKILAQEGDLIVMAADDGLFDYLYPCQIFKVL